MTVQQTLLAISALAIALIVASCGGGSGSSAPSPTPAPDPDPDPEPEPDAPFGLTVRQSLANFTLPVQSGAGNAFALQSAFPNQGFASPTYATGIPGENRIAVLERRGRIRAFTNERQSVGSRLIVDISGQIRSGGEQGLLGLAFDPAFAQNRYIYLNYIVRGTTQTRVSRFTWDAGTDLVDPASEKIILEVDQPFGNHNGGHVAFGPDGYLYIGLGDGGDKGNPFNNAQDVSSLLGKMLRIDVHPNTPSDPYDVPLDNPFVSEPGVRPEIYAIGLRNPWRFSFDRQSGDLLLGDVGQNRMEEIDHIVAGGNYGWRVFEGTGDYDANGNSLPNSAFTPPLTQYRHSPGASVTGGYVYRGSNLAALFGRYVYADYVSGTVWAFNWDGTQATNNQIIATATSPSSFGETNEGELLIVSLAGGIFQRQDNGGGGEIPTLLSQTGLFTNLATLAPASGLIEYTVRHPFYSDHADKRRWVGLPNGTQVDFADDDLIFPTGTVVVQHFTMNMIEGDVTSARRLETRVLLNTDTGWLGLTYRWDANETEATLLNSRESETLSISLVGGGTREQTYDYPSRTDCWVCHTASAGSTLGLKTPQLNGNFDYNGTVDNQLRSWNNIDLFDTDIGNVSQYDQFVQLGDTSANLTTRARTYLDVNCSHCHRPNGPTGTNLDLRFESSDMSAIGVAPTGGNLGIADALIIASGDHQRSILWQRM